MKTYKKISDWICKILNLSAKAINTSLFIGTVLGLVAVVHVNGMEVIKLNYLTSLSYERINQVSMSPPYILLFWEAIKFILPICVVTAIAMVGLIEIIARALGAFGLKKTWMYRFLAHKDCD
jgi:hypothetical protein